MAAATHEKVTRAAAEYGVPEAQLEMGYWYETGLGVPKDPVEAVRWYMKAAEQGYAEAQHNLGVMYSQGEGVSQDKKEAVKWYTRAAEQGLTIDQYNLGVMYYHAKGVERDYAKAAMWFLRAADGGYVGAQYSLALMYASGRGVPQDPNNARRWYVKAAEQGHAEAQYSLGIICYDSAQNRERESASERQPELYGEAISWLTKAAEQGHREAQFRLGNMHATGTGFPYDDSEAAAWYEKAAEQGHVYAQYFLGCSYRSGSGVPKNLPEAFKWYAKAADQGYADAQFELAIMCHYGTGTSADPNVSWSWFLKAAQQEDNSAVSGFIAIHPQEAVQWFSKAAEAGFAYAQYELGLMHQEGEAVPKDHKLAAEWLTKAAERGHVLAQWQVFCIKYTGDGTTHEYEEAVRWLARMAHEDNPAAQYWLGLMYRDGQGVNRDANQAVAWLSKAAEHDLITVQVLLGLMYGEGVGIQQNEVEAAKWFARANSNSQWRAFTDERLPQVYGRCRYSVLAPLGPESVQAKADATTCFVLGTMYAEFAETDATRRAGEEAARWFTKAATKGLVQAKLVLAAMYADGDGVPQDDTRAAAWLTDAVDLLPISVRRSASTQYELSRMYNGLDDSKNEMAWLTRAAEQNHAEAQYQLALCHWHGLSKVLEDYVEAYKWFLLAESNGYSYTRGLRELLRKEMTPLQIAEAQGLARAFAPANSHRSREHEQDQATVTVAATGFFVSPAGHILTARHVVEQAARVEVIHNEQSYPARVILQDESTDVAVLKIEAGESSCLPLASSAAVKPGDPVFTVGFPQVSVQGMEAKFTEGSISALSGMGNSPRFFQISVPVQPGNSGGPLVNETGEVVGMIVSRLDDMAALTATGAVPQTVNYAIKSSFILPLVESVPGLAEKLPKSSAAKDRSTAIDTAKQAVVLIIGYGARGDSEDPSLP